MVRNKTFHWNKELDLFQDSDDKKTFDLKLQVSQKVNKNVNKIMFVSPHNPLQLHTHRPTG